VKISSLNLNQEDPDSLKERIQTQMKEDRDLVDKAQNAFVSYVRYYKEHNLPFIFPFSKLEVGQVANAFYLFKVPRVKEILGRKLEGF